VEGSEVSRHQEILFGVGAQTFELDVLDGRPSAPSVTVYHATSDDDGATEAATTGAAEIDSVDTTLDVAASSGSQELELDSVDDVAKGRRYLLGGLEWCEVMGIAGTTVTLRRPLINDHAIGATFEGCRISIGVLDAWAADRNKLTAAGYRLRWTYTVNGKATVGVSYAAVVRYPSRALLSALDVDDRIPGWIDRLPPDHKEDQGSALIASAFEALRFDALADAKLLGLIRDTQTLKELAIYRANLISVEAQVMAGSANTLAVDTALRLYSQRYQQLLREPKIPVDAGGDGAASKARRLPLWRR
jgi:hypothetical protein